MQDKLTEYRGLIDEVDDEIIELLKHRYSLTFLLHHYKNQNYLPAVDETRQSEVVAKYIDALGQDVGREIGSAITGGEEP